MFKVTYLCKTADALDLIQSTFRDTRCADVQLYGVEVATIDGVNKDRHPRAAPQPYRRSGNVRAAVFRALKDHPGLCTRRLVSIEAIKAMGLIPKNVQSVLSRGRVQGHVIRKETNGLGGWYLTDSGRRWLIEHDRAQANGSSGHHSSVIRPEPQPRHHSGLKSKDIAFNCIKSHGDDGCAFGEVQKAVENGGFSPGTACGATARLKQEGRVFNLNGIWKLAPSQGNGHAGEDHPR